MAKRDTETYGAHCAGALCVGKWYTLAERGHYGRDRDGPNSEGPSGEECCRSSHFDGALSPGL
jgi:hypothetical protein